jgi:hypothetical protein
MQKNAQVRYNYILGDFHAKIGKDNFMDNVAGKFSLHEETSGKGILLGHLAIMYHPVIKSTYFQHTNVHRKT